MKNILITGVSTGIGYSLVKAFIDKGYFVFGSVRNQEDSIKLKNQFKDNFCPLIFDVTDTDSVIKSLEIVKEKVGDNGLSGLINNAGIALGGPLLFTSIEEYKRQFDVNVFGLITVTQVFLPLLGATNTPSKNPPGKIINISSVNGKIALPFLSPYAGSKHALEGISDSLRRELMPYGIDVIIIEPGAIKTPIWEKESAVAEIPKEVLESPMGIGVKKFKEAFVKVSNNGIDPDFLSKKILKWFEKKKPKARYALSSNQFIGWILPRYIVSSRTYDKLIAKALGLRKRKQ